jgi:hypothetical protein
MAQAVTVRPRPPGFPVNVAIGRNHQLAGYACVISVIGQNVVV